MAEDIKKIIKQAAKETAKEVRREFEVLTEDLEKNVIKAMREELQTNSQRLDRIEKQTGRMETKLDKMDGRLAVIETTLESVNLPILKQKVIGLEKRIDILESKLRPA